MELGVIIGSRATNVKESEAMKYVGGYALGLDMTARDWQSEAKKNGLPWSLAKGFDTSCPVSAFIEKDKVRSLYVNISSLSVSLNLLPLLYVSPSPLSSCHLSMSLSLA